MKRKTATFCKACVQIILALAVTFGLIVIFQKPFDTVHHNLRILVTGDVHGQVFDSTYTSDAIVPSLQNVSYYVDSIRNAEGEENVLLLDLGDCLQGDNASYYFNFVDTLSEHLQTRMMAYMGYDAWIIGNHDIEAGHRTFDRVSGELGKYGIVSLAGNTPTGKGDSYFEEYKVFRKAGLKVLLIGYTNANVNSWVSKSVSSGMSFESVAAIAQQRVNDLRRKCRPDVVIIAMHSGVGKGDGTQLESEALDVYNSIEGVDVVIAAHDHQPRVENRGDVCLVDAGAKCGNMGSCLVSVRKKLGRIVSSECEASIIRIDKDNVDERMVEEFHDDYCKVKDFTVRPIGKLECALSSKEAYVGMSNYVNLVQTIQRSVSGADVSFCAPLSYNGYIAAGTVIYDDLFTIYPYENTLVKVSMTGKQIKDYLEYSYGMWVGGKGGNILNIKQGADTRTGSDRWSFVARSYNFDAAAGIIYEVYPLEQRGSRVVVKSLADGSAFDENKTYSVALSSYRANGGGELLTKGAGISADELENIVLERYGDLRTYVYDFFCAHETVGPEAINDTSVLGSWSFEPESVRKRVVADRDLVFGK